MGRARGIFRMSALAGIACLGVIVADPSFSEETGARRFMNEDPAPLDPACLWPVLDTIVSPDASPPPDAIALQDCAPEDSETIVEDGWHRVSFTRDGGPDGFTERRFTGAKVALITGGGTLVLETYDNRGGSGVFSALVVGQLADDGARLAEVKAQALGDRCNGGIAGTEKIVDGRLLVRTAMTPLDVLMAPLADLPQQSRWEEGQARFGDAFDAAPVCASCCSSVVHVQELDWGTGELASIGLEIGRQEHLGSQGDDPLSVCLEEAVRASMSDKRPVPRSSPELAERADACAAGYRPPT